jgi:hypothetical protein
MGERIPYALKFTNVRKHFELVKLVSNAARINILL